MSNTHPPIKGESCGSPQRVLRSYGLRSVAPLVAVSGGFSGAAVWRVEAETGTFALRRWPIGGLPDERILGLHALLAHVKANGVEPVAVPVRNTQGTTLTRSGGGRWQVEPWLPGVADFHAAPNDARLVAVMQSLAAWHRAARTFVPPADARDWFAGNQGPCSSVLRRLSLCRQWPDQLQRLRPATERDESQFGALAERISRLAVDQLPRMQRELSGFTDVAVSLQPCLRDIWHDHVLFDRDEVTGLIDASAASTASVATDLARLLGSLLGDETMRWKAAIEHYDRLRPLSAVEQSLIVTLDRAAVVLSPLTWLRRRYVEATPIDEAVVVARLEQLLVRLEHLAGR